MSVCTVVYNHEPFLHTTFDSILGQHRDFAMEVIPGEDCSQDGSRDIVLAYAREHPDVVRPLLHPVNQGPQQNFLAILRRCRGRYVALCDGDDYWTDPQKLAKQVSYLESHPGAAVCFHNAWVEDPDGSRVLFHDSPPKRVNQVSDLLRRWLMPTATVVFRNPRLDVFPPFVVNATHGDLALFLFLAQGGTLHYLDEVMSVYRRHGRGATASFRGVDFNRREIKSFQEIDTHFQGAYRGLIRRRIAGLFRSNALHLAWEGRRRQALGELVSSWRARLPTKGREFRESAQVLLAAAAPGVYRRVRVWWRGEAE